MQQLHDLGFQSVPVVQLNDQATYAIDLQRVADLLQLEYDAVPVYDPTELIRKLCLIINAVVVHGEELPRELLTESLPGRDRTILSLLNHIVEIPYCFVEVCDGQPFDESRANAEPDENFNVPKLGWRARRLTPQLEKLHHDWSHVIETYYGSQTRHQVLERVTWHCAQHLRQLTQFAERHNIVFTANVDESEFVGLPMPENVYDDLANVQ